MEKKATEGSQGSSTNAESAYYWALVLRRRWAVCQDMSYAGTSEGSKHRDAILCRMEKKATEGSQGSSTWEDTMKEGRRMFLEWKREEERTARDYFEFWEEYEKKKKKDEEFWGKFWETEEDPETEDDLFKKEEEEERAEEEEKERRKKRRNHMQTK